MGKDYTLPTIEAVAGQMGLPPAVAKKLLNMVPARLRIMAADLRGSLEARDCELTAKHAHAVKGVCANLRLQPIVDIAAALEAEAKAQRLPEDGGSVCDDLEAYAGVLEGMLAGGTGT